MCVVCLDYSRGAISRKEALIHLTEMIAIAAEENDEMFTHLEEIEQNLLDEEYHELD